MAANSQNFSFGYPTPGPQHPTGDNVMDHAFFLDQSSFKTARENEQFDYVVIGSGFCSLAFVDRLLALEESESNPNHPWSPQHPRHKDHPARPKSLKKARILVIESGPFFLPCHFQNLPHSFKETLGNLSTTFPWSVSYQMSKEGDPDQHQLRFSQGMVPFFGGRSTLWSAWCPEPGVSPNLDELRGWPKKLKHGLKEKAYFDSARALLNVVPTDHLYDIYKTPTGTPIAEKAKADKNGHTPAKGGFPMQIKGGAVVAQSSVPVIPGAPLAGAAANGDKPAEVGIAAAYYSQLKLFSFMQETAFKRVQAKFPDVMCAPLAVASHNDISVDFNKYATPGPYLDLISRVRSHIALGELDPENVCLKLATNCSVTRIISDKTSNGTHVAKALETFTPGRRGVDGGNTTIIPIDGAKLIIAAGVYPATTLIRNSFPHITNAGERASSHCVSSIIARFPIPAEWKDKLNPCELGALYIPGTTKKEYHYHIQMTLLRDTDPTKHFEIALRHMPDVVATADLNQLKQSTNHIVVVCASLGEVNWRDKNNWYRKDPSNPDIYTNSLLQSVLGPWDQEGWTALDNATFDAISAVAGSEDKHVEYWVTFDKPLPNGQTGEFKRMIPDRNGKDWRLFRKPGIFHECSTLHMGDVKAEGCDPDVTEVQGNSVVGLDYRPHGVDNVYVTGGGLLPTADAWNPTLTLCAMAQQLADEIRH